MMAEEGDAIHEMAGRIDEAAAAEQMQMGATAVSNGRGGEGEENDYDEASLLELLEHIDREAGSAENGSRSRYRPGEGGFSDFPDFMRDPVIR